MSSIDAKGTAEKLGLSLLSIEVVSRDDIEQAFAVFVINDPVTVNFVFALGIRVKRVAAGTILIPAAR
jgi:hypothetical protein